MHAGADVEVVLTPPPPCVFCTEKH
jgi:hypothetical protein